MNQGYHFIGIGGIGMSGLARILTDLKMSVTGSDLTASYVTESLEKLGISVFIGHQETNVPPQATVVYSSDIKQGNPELAIARQRGQPVLHRSDLLVQLMERQEVLAVAGTHGKTTTSALLTTVLFEAGMEPSFAVGGMVFPHYGNGAWGGGRFFVAEADESDGTFLKYHPFGAILTNIDRDHLNHFGSEEAIVAAFDTFAKHVQCSQHLFWCGDDHHLRKIMQQGVSYGLGPSCTLRAENRKQIGWRQTFDIVYQGQRFSDVEIALAGVHNVCNALAVFGLAHSLGIHEQVIRRAFATFGGVKRRCQKIAEEEGLLILDDYAHHPTEIKTTLNGIRQAIGNRRLLVIFQSHRYTRTSDCLGQFGTVFESADEVILTEIYAAGEAPIEGVTHDRLLSELQQDEVSACYLPRKKVAEIVLELLQDGDVVVTMGAGDITKVGPQLAALVRDRRYEDSLR